MFPALSAPQALGSHVTQTAASAIWLPPITGAAVLTERLLPLPLSDPPPSLAASVLPALLRQMGPESGVPSISAALIGGTCPSGGPKVPREKLERHLSPPPCLC